MLTQRGAAVASVVGASAAMGGADDAADPDGVAGRIVVAVVVLVEIERDGMLVGGVHYQRSWSRNGSVAVRWVT